MKKKVHIKNWHAYLIFAVLAFIIYGGSVNNGYNLDDNYVVEKHPLVEKGVSGIPEIFASRYHTEKDMYFGYRPVTTAVFALEYELFGYNAGISHIINLLLYVISVILLLGVLRKLIPDMNPWFICLVCLVFLVHPIHSEVVLSLKNREEILSLIFSLLAWKYFLIFYDKRRWHQIVIGVLFLGIGFLSKENAAVFVGIIPLSLTMFKTHIPLGLSLKRESKKSGEVVFGLTESLVLVFQAGLFVLAFYMNEWAEGILVHALLSISIPITSKFYEQYKRKTAKVWTNIRDPFYLGFIIFLVLTLLVYWLGIDSLPDYFIQIASVLIIIGSHREHLHKLRKRFDGLIQFIRQWKKVIIPIAFLTLIGVITVLAAFYLPDAGLPEKNAPVHNWQNPLFQTDNSIATKIGVPLYTLVYYLKLLFVPHPLRFYYGYAMIPDVGLGHPIVLLSILIHASLIFLFFRGLKKNNILSFGIGIYLISILPFSNLLFPMTGIIAERWLFVPSIGFALAIVYLIFRISKTPAIVKEKSGVSLPFGAIVLSLLIVLPFSVMSYQRVPDWEKRETLYEADIPHLKKSAKANNLYANLIISKVYTIMKKGIPPSKMDDKINLAIKHYQQAIEVDSSYSNPLHNIGYIYLIIGRNYKVSEEYFTASIKADSTLYEAYLNRGVARFYLEKYDAAINDLITCAAKGEDKEKDKAYYYLGRAYKQKQDTVSAIEYFNKSVEQTESKLNPRRHLRDIYLAKNEFDEALSVSKQIIQSPKKSADDLAKHGDILMQKGEDIIAVHYWERAYKMNPRIEGLSEKLYEYYAEKGIREKADYFLRKMHNQ